MSADSPELSVAICGCGMRSRSVWQPRVLEHGSFVLAGVQDPSDDSLGKAIELGQIERDQAFNDLDEMLATTKPDVAIVCPIHSAHAQAAEKALRAGCHVLVEKPFTTELSDAVRLTALAEELGLKLGVVQNWRPKSAAQALKQAVDEGMIGQVSHIFLRYLRDREQPHLPDYLFDEPEPMLFAVAIHHFDLFRWVLGEEIVQVSGHHMRPPWTRYRHPSVMQLWMETESGVAISYMSTFSSRNGGHFAEESYQFEGDLGTLYSETNYTDPPMLLARRNDAEPVDLTADVTERDSASQYMLADRAILENFRRAATEGEELLSPAADNLWSLAVVEAARRCLHERRAVSPYECVEHARRAAGASI